MTIALRAYPKPWRSVAKINTEFYKAFPDTLLFKRLEWTRSFAHHRNAFTCVYCRAEWLLSSTVVFWRRRAGAKTLHVTLWSFLTFPVFSKETVGRNQTPPMHIALVVYLSIPQNMCQPLTPSSVPVSELPHTPHLLIFL